MVTSFHFYLKDRKKKNGEYPIYLRITNNRKHKYVSTGLSVLQKHWNPNTEEVRRSHSNYKTLNMALEQKEKEARTIQTELNKTGAATAKTIRDRLKNTQKAEFFAIADELYSELKADRKFHVHKKLKVVLKKLEHFEGERSIPLAQIDSAYLKKFERFLRNEYQNSDTTINKNFQLIRKVIDRALKAHLISLDPFKYYDVPSEAKPEPKTKLTYDQISLIENLELEHDSLEWHARNAFLFSFYSGGIRFGDICCLTWENVKNGKLSYTMNKNEKPFSSDLNNYQVEILSKYSGAGDDFIFPFLNNHKDYSDPEELRRDISTSNALVNGKTKKDHETGLKLIAKLAGIKENISFHVSRHSFAQYAVSEKGLSVYEAMQALKHSNLETTQRYLKSLDEELVNKAMKKVF